MENATDRYCEINNKSYEDLNDYDDETIWCCAANHIVYFLTWLIKNDFYNYHQLDNIEEVETDLKSIKNQEADAIMMLSGYLDTKFYRNDLVEEILEFVDYYYDIKYMMDYKVFVENELNKKVYAVEFDWDEYNAFEKYIDIAYSEFVKNSR